MKSLTYAQKREHDRFLDAAKDLEGSQTVIGMAGKFGFQYGEPKEIILNLAVMASYLREAMGDDQESLKLFNGIFRGENIPAPSVPAKNL